MIKSTAEVKSTEDQLQMTDITNHKSVIAFIQKVLDQVYTEDEGKVIKDELLDHLFSLTEDYMAAGHYKEASIRKALLQMGDPTEIGYSFTDYEGMKRRKFLRIGLKVLASILILATLGAVMFFSGASTEPRVDEPRSLGDLWSLLFNCLYFPMLFYFNFQSQGLSGMNGIPVHQLKISQDPLLVLWAYKKRFPWEYFFISIFFLPIVLVFMVIFAYEGNNIFFIIGFIAIIAFSIWLFIHSEKYRIPKYLILEDGIVIKNRFFSWTAIDRVSWSRDYMASNEKHYKLIIEHIHKLSNNNKATPMTIKKSIDVNANQYHQVISILRERV
ncbi:permease prefix domain 1-containing protein [Fusibacter ferrireducens]|uniref:DUF5673 domain-containing protein n=1 Tax=Fusibacter ferrireducens TaxID=2785058 RepID=A0ABR9ZRH8_9FIRM|nr:permease prefix domain 1-containing protein [Fusibacter ferrireducens]MBF4692581.1 hypothetical protein [Fusibacter ferrireducens]